MNSFRALSFLSVSLSLALGTEAQQVFIVDDDGGPGVDFLTVGEALAASEEGATIYVRPGAYEEFLGIDFSVSILVRPGATVDGSIWVHDLGPNQSVYLRGIDMANIGPLSEVLIAEGNLGSLIVESCRFRGSPVSFHTPDSGLQGMSGATNGSPRGTARPYTAEAGPRTTPAPGDGSGAHPLGLPVPSEHEYMTRAQFLLNLRMVTSLLVDLAGE